MYQIRSVTRNANYKPFSGGFDEQLDTQAPDYFVCFAVYITSELMSIFAFLPMTLGIGAGLLLGLAATKRLIVHCDRSSKVAPAVGGALATVPAIFLSIVIGGTAGGGFGEALLGQAGIAVGLAVGIATVLGAGIALGAIAGAAMGWLVARTYRAAK